MGADWIAVDWGLSRLRAWRMQGAQVLDQAASDQGVNRMAGRAFEAALLDLIAPWLDGGPVDVIACGMVGARDGWQEVPYGAVPAAPLGRPVAVSATDTRLRIFVVPGLAQAKPADVMRGEEAQIAGFLALKNNWDGVICLPGTHTKWVLVSADEVVSFQSFMTGELFDLLRARSVLRHGLSADWDGAAFEAALDDMLSRPEALAARLFGLRANGLVSDVDVSVAALSGLLIGAELAAARPYWLGQQIAVIGESELAGRYVQALARVGAPATLAKADAMVLAGLGAARAMLQRAG